MTRGVLYVATGEKNRARALISASSIKQHMPEMSVSFVSDTAISDSLVENNLPFHPGPHFYAQRINHMAASPYDHTLSLDVDTFVCAPFPEMFDLLDQFDIAIVHDTYRLHAQGYELLRPYIEAIPASFPMVNAGVILFCKSDATQKLFEDWQRLYNRDLEVAERAKYTATISDQPALREALYCNPAVRLAILPSEYNCRFMHPVFLNDTVKILHGPHRDLPALAAEINRVQTNRVFLPELGTIPEKSPPFLFSRWSIKQSLDRTRRRLARSWRHWFGSSASRSTDSASE
jgi:hypothetical protein